MLPRSGNTTTIAEVAPASLTATVGTAELLRAVRCFVARFSVLPGAAEAAAIDLFVFHTWAIGGAHATPYLVVVSPERRTGKTRLMEVLRLLTRCPWHTTSTTEAALFRKIDQDSPTLLLDEIDAVFGSNSERTEPLRAILNAGNRRGATATRVVPPKMEVRDFTVFCPKVLAGIDTGRLPDTIKDRAIVVRMKRRHDGEMVERFRERNASADAAAITEMARAPGPTLTPANSAKPSPRCRKTSTIGRPMRGSHCSRSPTSLEALGRHGREKQRSRYVPTMRQTK